MEFCFWEITVNVDVRHQMMPFFDSSYYSNGLKQMQQKTWGQM